VNRENGGENELTITRTRLQEAAEELAAFGWEHREEPEELERVAEIRQLLADQIADDSYTVAGELHRKNSEVDTTPSRVILYGGSPRDTDWIINRPITDEQLMLEYGFQPLLDEWLTTDEADLVRWTHAAQLSVRQLVEVLPQERIQYRGKWMLRSPSKDTVHRRIKALHDKIRGKLEELVPVENPTYDSYRALLVSRGRAVLEAERDLRRRYRRR